MIQSPKVEVTCTKCNIKVTSAFLEPKKDDEGVDIYVGDQVVYDTDPISIADTIFKKGWRYFWDEESGIPAEIYCPECHKEEPRTDHW